MVMVMMSTININTDQSRRIFIFFERVRRREGQTGISTHDGPRHRDHITPYRPVRKGSARLSRVLKRASNSTP